ncbi:MAG TPA: hypothetical protein PKE45_11770 [Caldilineaceae bacterium]|nr:hypothetical protein [Caldilineaceae bacterium]
MLATLEWDQTGGRRVILGQELVDHRLMVIPRAHLLQSGAAGASIKRPITGPHIRRKGVADTAQVGHIYAVEWDVQTPVGMADDERL